jgi:hypothetical protein
MRITVGPMRPRWQQSYQRRSRAVVPFLHDGRVTVGRLASQ